MRFVTRTLAFVIVILVAFWFTAENANEIVNIDLAFLRIRASLPLVVFSAILGGMGLSAWFGWRAERRARLREASRSAAARSLRDPTFDFVEDAAAREPEPAERYPLG